MHSLTVLTAFLLVQCLMDCKNSSHSLWKNENKGLLCENLHLWMWNLAKIIIRLTMCTLFFLLLLKNPNRTCLYIKLKSLIKVTLINLKISRHSLLVYTQCQKRWDTVSGWVEQKQETSNRLQLFKEMFSRIVFVHELKWFLFYFVCDEIFVREQPDLLP